METSYLSMLYSLDLGGWGQKETINPRVYVPILEEVGGDIDNIQNSIGEDKPGGFYATQRVTGFPPVDRALGKGAGWESSKIGPVFEKGQLLFIKGKIGGKLNLIVYLSKQQLMDWVALGARRGSELCPTMWAVKAYRPEVETK